MARRGLLSTADVLEELELDQGDFDADEPMMLGSDDEFDDVYLEDLEDEDDEDDNRDCYSPPPSDTPGSSLNTPTLNGSPGSSSHTPTPNGSSSNTPTPNGAPGTSSDTPPSWSSILTSVNVQPFNSPVGPKVAIPESPSDTFELLFTPTLLDDIAEQSNVYAKEVMGDEKFNSWPKITREELKAYLGFCVLMGINHLPALDDYWSKDPMYHYSPIADRITRDRFRDISRYLHFVENATLTPRGSPGYDRLGKVRPVIDHLSSRFSDLYDPHREVAVDEAMIKFTGRSTLKQFMPMKPVKRGIKVWALADSHNGYFHKFQVYTGKEGSGEKQLGQRVVKDLTQHLKGKNHHVFFDNFFTSEKLLRDLAEDDIYACGTARKDRRGFPPTLKTAKLKNRCACVRACVYACVHVCMGVCALICVCACTREICE